MSTSAHSGSEYPAHDRACRGLFCKGIDCGICSGHIWPMKQPKNKAPSYPAHVMWPQTLEYVGRTLFGRQWRTHVARTLKVPQKTITKWMTEGAPGWTCAHLEKIGYAKYEKLAHVEDKPDYAAMRKLSDATDALYSQRCAYRKFKGLPPPPWHERPKQVENVKLPTRRE